MDRLVICPGWTVLTAEFSGLNCEHRVPHLFSTSNWCFSRACCAEELPDTGSTEGKGPCSEQGLLEYYVKQEEDQDEQ